MCTYEPRTYHLSRVCGVLAAAAAFAFAFALLIFFYKIQITKIAFWVEAVTHTFCSLSVSVVFLLEGSVPPDQY